MYRVYKDKLQSCSCNPLKHLHYGTSGTVGRAA